MLSGFCNSVLILDFAQQSIWVEQMHFDLVCCVLHLHLFVFLVTMVIWLMQLSVTAKQLKSAKLILQASAAARDNAMIVLCHDKKN